MSLRSHVYIVVLIIAGACTQSNDYLFKTLSETTTGIDFRNQLEQTPELNILTYLYYYNGAGVAASDFNNDGLLDLYFTGNQVADRLYLNQGGLKFKDVTEESGIPTDKGWTTGVTHVDINNDGWLDLYVCKVDGLPSSKGNLLLVNSGIDENGIPQFKEAAKEYGLNFTGLSTQAGFFDFDLDGDLDMYLLNHSTHPNRSYGKGAKRNEIDTLSGDRLYENREGYYFDVSQESGIYQGSIGYGLGLSFGDFNQDGYPDIYVGNDFFENDYLYMNNGDGTFTDLINESPFSLGHTTHYSMGNSIADLNNDGKPDILSLDMLPEDIETYKSSGSEDPYPTYDYFLQNGYSPQYMQNALHINDGQGLFREVANYAGIAATEWSWSVLAADLDMDGFRDLYISNGIKGATNDMDFVSFIAQEKIQKQLGENMTAEGMQFIDQLPTKKLGNYSFRNSGAVSFEDMKGKWFESKTTFSNGAIYADLDNDGDVEIVVNNIDESASLFENSADNLGRNFIKVDFEGPPQNRNGIGTKVYFYSGGMEIFEENYPSRSYLSAIPSSLTIGLAESTLIDSIIVVWPGGRFEKLKNINVNQKLTLDYENASGSYYEISRKSKSKILVNSDQSIDFRHQDANSLEFNRQPLIPFASGNGGPAISVGDISGDGLDDIFIGGGKWQSSQLYIQNTKGEFSSDIHQLFVEDLKKEETDNCIFDVDGDGDLDIVSVAGGNEFVNGEALKPNLYLNDEGKLVRALDRIPNLNINASSVLPIDLENDGDLDLIITSNTIPNEFGKISKNYILLNDGKGYFTESTQLVSDDFMNAGLIEDIAHFDFDGNGFEDLLVVGLWMEPTIFYNFSGKLRSKSLVHSDAKGWWNTIEIADFDQDGDQDIIAGNWGLNTRLKASKDEPVTLYRYDFDSNEKIDPVLTYFYNGKEIALASKVELSKQLPFLNKKFLSYSDFAQATLKDLFGEDKLGKAEKLKLTELASCYFENKGNNTFDKRLLPLGAQYSSVHDIEIDDFNQDGYLDALLVGNTLEISTQLGRLDASHGVLLLNDQKGFFEEHDQTFNVSGASRDIEKIVIMGKDHWIVSINNGTPVFLKRSE